MTRGKGRIESEVMASKRAKYLAAGTCTECGQPRAEGDTRFCARHREYARERSRKRRRDEHGCGSRLPRRRAITTADVGQPVRPLVGCRTCYDQPWRRPRHTPCPECWGTWARERTTDAAELCCRRESVGPW
jgi:hypothetical protein